MNAILWDGNKQLHGFIEFTDMELIFRLKDFSETSLHLFIPYRDVTKVGTYKLYGIAVDGIEIISKDGKRNIFVVEDVRVVKDDLKSRMQ